MLDTSPAGLVFSVQPISTSAYAVMSPMEVSLVDAQGRLAVGPEAQVTIRIGTYGASGAVLSGTLRKMTLDGVTVFDDLIINQSGAGFTLSASAIGVETAVSVAFAVGPWAGMPTRITLDSDGGDYIGQGRSYEYTNRNARLSVTSAGGLLSVDVEGDEWWFASFQSPDSLAKLTPGVYEDLMRYPFHNPIKGGLSWSGEGRGCNRLTGWFAVDTVRYRASELSAVHLRFVQRCESSTAALRGTVHWDEADPVPPRPVG